MKGQLEQYLNFMSSEFFFKEFTFSDVRFSFDNQSEIELADLMLVVGKVFILFQLKERNREPLTSNTKEDRWFERKVLRKAIDQFANVDKAVKRGGAVSARSVAGIDQRFSALAFSDSVKMVIYSADPMLSTEMRGKKTRTSRRIGLVHLMEINDYIDVCRQLMTPMELHDYLMFRKSVVEKFPEAAERVTEDGLLGQFVSGRFEDMPDSSFEESLAALRTPNVIGRNHRLIKLFKKSLVGGAVEHYHLVLRELALLRRNILQILWERIDLAIESCRKDSFRTPMRFSDPVRSSGFVIVPIQRDMRDHRLVALRNFTLAHKYDQRLRTCVGVAITKDDDYFLLEWCLAEFDWAFDDLMDEALKRNFPFLEVRQGQLSSYEFSSPRP